MSQPTTHPDRSHSAGADSNLRQRMQDALAQPYAQEQPYAEQQQDALQSRVMAQWRQRTAAGATVVDGPVASLRRALMKRPLQMGLASLALVAVVGLQTTLLRGDAALEELMEPDLLSLITLGEL